jgi:hypothetical protein
VIEIFEYIKKFELSITWISVLSTGWAVPIQKYTVDFIKSYMAKNFLSSSSSKNFNRSPEKWNLDKTLTWIFH